MGPNPHNWTALAPTGYAPGGVTYRPRPVRQQSPVGGYMADPGVVSAGLARNQANANANAALRQQRSQAIIGYGDPTLAWALGLAVDPNTAAAAAANGYSTVAGLGLQHQDAQRAILNSLAGRGILHSGELGYQQGRESHAYGQATYNAQNALLDQLNNYLNSYLGVRQQGDAAYNQALLDAYTRQQQAILAGVM